MTTQRMFAATPSRWAGLAGAVDRSSPRITARLAVLLCLAAYSLFFGRGIYLAIRAVTATDAVRTIDASTVNVQLGAVGDVCGIAGAVAIFTMVCRWLAIPRALAGVPPRRRKEQVSAGQKPACMPSGQAPAWYTLVVALCGLCGAAGVNLLLSKFGALTGTDQPFKHDPWTVAVLLLHGINAGVVEEIIVVAIPVLVIRRIGWHPLAVIGFSVLLRWPYHIYHGLWQTVPWTIVWGGAFAAAYLWLRRLWPLMVCHMVFDSVNAAAAVGGLTGWLIGLGTVAVTTAFGTRVAVQKRRRRRIIMTAHGEAVTYNRAPCGDITILDLNRQPDVWAALIAVCGDTPRRGARDVTVAARRRSNVTAQLAAHGHAYRRWRYLRIPITAVQGSSRTAAEHAHGRAHRGVAGVGHHADCGQRA